MAIMLVNCVSWHPRLWTGGFRWSSFTTGKPLLMANSELGLGKRCQSRPEWCCL